MRTKIFTTVLFVDIIIFLIFVYLILGAQSVLLDIRHSLFAEITENSEVFEITKTKAAQKYSFLIENQNAIRDYSQKIMQNVNYITPANEIYCNLPLRLAATPSRPVIFGDLK